MPTSWRSRGLVIAACISLALGIAHYALEHQRAVDAQAPWHQPPMWMRAENFARGAATRQSESLSDLIPTYAATLRECRQLIDSLRRGRTEHRFAVSPRDSVLLSAPPCRFQPLEAPELDFDAGYTRETAIVISLYALFLLGLGILVLTYSHVGWRRLAVVLGAVVGAVTFGYRSYFSYNLIDSGFISAAIAVGSAAAILLAREASAWVRRGFGGDAPPGAV